MHVHCLNKLWNENFLDRGTIEVLNSVQPELEVIDKSSTPQNLVQDDPVISVYSFFLSSGSLILLLAQAILLA